MLIMRPRPQSGDTIIEVMFAVAVFAMVAVGCVSIMNQGMATAQRSLEVTLVRQQVDAQAETLRYIHDAYIAQYQAGVTPLPNSTAAQWHNMMTDLLASGASEFGQTTANKCPTLTPGEHPFILDTHNAKVASATPTMNALVGSSLPPYSQVVYKSDGTYQAYGLWIEAVPAAAQNGTRFIDFHIRACWDGPGANAPMTLGTIVRLYEPHA